MLRTTVLALLLGLLPSYLHSAEQNIINKEVRDAIYALQNDFSYEDAKYIRFLSTYSTPEAKREETVLTASFILHSLVGVSNDEYASAGGYYPLAIQKDLEFRPIRLVKGSKSLWWIDLRDYNFTPEAWEKVAALDPYFVQPFIKEAESGLLRILSGNAIISMPWFIYHVSDSSQEITTGRNLNIYTTLLYASTQAPKTIDEFRKVWGLPNIDKSRQLGNEFSALVTKSKNVALHNRMLFGYLTELGWYYQSYDVLNQEGKRDYLESIYEFQGKPPPLGTFDAGEAFATNQLKMQVYTLYNDKEELIDFADPRVARHVTDVIGNVAVRTPHSCMDCHSSGPIVSENTLKEFINARMSIYLPKKADSLRIERSMLSDKFEEAVQEHQNSYARSLLRINGLTPEENVKSYLDTIVWYEQPLNLEDVARECGITQTVLVEGIKKGLQDFNHKVPARLDLLIKTGEPIPRDIFDSPGKDGKPGIFQQIMTILYGVTIDQTIVSKETVVKMPVYIVNKNCNIMSGSKILETIVEGTEVKITKETVGSDGKKWVFISPGWILAENVTIK